MSERTFEQRRFTLHPAIFWQLINRQSGTREKALLEAVMNSIDAGATEVRLSVDAERYSVVDDGRGFESETVISEFFAQFGTPHEDGDAVYGTFRIGRGQLMSFSVNTWRSGPFRMTVDVKRLGDSFEFEKDLPHQPGCRIEGVWYDRMRPSELAATRRALKDLVAWAPVPVFLDGKQLNKRPETGQWDVETEDAYIRFKDSGGLVVYNLGVLVREYPAYTYGTAGIVVSKKALSLNTARNDILQSHCPVWKRVAKILREQGGARSLKKPRLTEGERDALARAYAYGERRYGEIASAKLVTDITGRATTLGRLGQERAVSLGPSPATTVAETAHQRRLAFVLAPETLERFDVESLEEFLALLTKRWRKEFRIDGPWSRIKIVPFEELAAQIGDAQEVLAPGDLTPRERAVLEAVGSRMSDLAWLLQRTNVLDGHRYSRRVCAGRSDTADGWTDGTSYIAINRRLLQEAADTGLPGFIAIVLLLLHEMIHDESSQGSHLHGPEFYEAYHTLVADHGQELVGDLAVRMFKAYLSRLERDEKRISRKALRQADLLAADPSGTGSKTP